MLNISEKIQFNIGNRPLHVCSLTSVTNVTYSHFNSNLQSRFPVFLSRTTRVLLHSSSYGPQPVTLLPPRLLAISVSFLPLLSLTLLSPGVPSQQQQPSAASLLSGESRCYRIILYSISQLVSLWKRCNNCLLHFWLFHCCFIKVHFREKCSVS